MGNLGQLPDGATQLVCPESKTPVIETTIADAERRIGATLVPAVRTGRNAKPVGRTERVLLREDLVGAYPVLEGGLPVLMAPEILLPQGSTRTFDLTQSQYAEAYEEMGHYDKVAADLREKIKAGESDFYFTAALKLSPEERRRDFPFPWRVWLDAPYDCLSQWDAYRHIGSVEGKVIVQLGGSGMHAVKFLLAGAREAWLLTPMPGELRYAVALAEHVGVGAGFRGVVAVGEELPFADNSVDAMYSGGCLHHMDTSKAMPEFNRVLRPGGALAASDPWKAALYSIGIKIFGKREVNVYCRPFTPARLAPLLTTFAEARAVHHGALTRYPLLALSKMGLNIPVSWTFPIFCVDDAVSSLIPGLRRQGGSITLLGRKGADGANCGGGRSVSLPALS
jgi:uncharacterized protein YbaR (Trm112 family)